MTEALDIWVKGIVQGVGFRPFVYRLAKRYLINGWVLNAADGVHIHAEGDSKLLDEFVLEISENAPAAAQVSEIEMKEVPLQEFDTFEIRFSEEAKVEETTLVSPDLGICEDCMRELLDPADRRYRYPFINCTNCGPRFTIIESLPYDRASTSMKDFPMCPTCAHEYADPLDRRFHAQPDACFDCGPQVSLTEITPDGPQETRWGTDREASDALIARSAELLAEGAIVAVKGLGGFHLVCDANNPEAVAALRAGKQRNGKAFAVMAANAQAASDYCEIDAVERKLLESPQRPIVLLKRTPSASQLAGIADGLSELGVMLPATPVQVLLMQDFAQAAAARGNTAVPLLVMTSGNLHDEPIVIDDNQAIEAFAGFACAILGNNRDILARYDDSVLRVIAAGKDNQAIQFIRRARGWAPHPIASSLITENVVAAGPEQKNTFALTRPGEAFVSQHIGDMADAETFDAYVEAMERYQELFELKADIIAADLHPEYLSTKWAEERLASGKASAIQKIQHHHAHIASVLGEYGLQDPVCGFAFDGTGYGEDGAIWGGEVLLANASAFERFANFAYVPMPGAAAAIMHPLRMAYGVLWAFDLLEHPAAQALLDQLGEQADICDQMIERGLNCPMTSSVGRLFDAASALLGVCTEPTYEGEAAVLLEACMDEAAPALPNPEGYRIDITKNTATENSSAQDTSVLLLDAQPLFAQMLDDMAAGVPVPSIARGFHDALVSIIVEVAQVLRTFYGLETIVLSGGVFMNRYLIEHAIALLAEAGFRVAINSDLPPNDGCISFGQAVIACARISQQEEVC